ncbi:hypothetical protein J7F02_34235 [Streptomyces sp. ISL-112]|uniref:hypothetical protein n=1 Tax=unclassified Streptomyces TaxID=2593676 RepID=UPI001BEA3F32|nr:MULTISPECIES: hypothetical protein [unclassified Streptomyces]MBT2430499.1 hypothetical protein [Streptomyces sp. ISL-112]MBT2462826.1 hypothetical protein [Streptomyces sp. ISL-63]
MSVPSNKRDSTAASPAAAGAGEFARMDGATYPVDLTRAATAFAAGHHPPRRGRGALAALFA